MADLNELKNRVIVGTRELGERMRALYNLYEQMYQESFKELSSSRNASGGSMEGLETFYTAVQTVRRNRDVIASLLKGLRSIRPLDGFQFIEEDIEEKKPKELNIGELKIEAPLSEPTTEENINA